MVRRSDQEVNCKSEALALYPPIYPSRECVAKDSSWFQQGMMIEARPSCVRRFTNQCRPFFSPPISAVPFSLPRGSLGMFHHGPPDASQPVVGGVSEGPGRILGAVSVVRS